jgi:hypothetical protein
MFDQGPGNWFEINLHTVGFWASPSCIFELHCLGEWEGTLLMVVVGALLILMWWLLLESHDPPTPMKACLNTSLSHCQVSVTLSTQHPPSPCSPPTLQSPCLIPVTHASSFHLSVTLLNLKGCTLTGEPNCHFLAVRFYFLIHRMETVWYFPHRAGGGGF